MTTHVDIMKENFKADFSPEIFKWHGYSICTNEFIIFKSKSTKI